MRNPARGYDLVTLRRLNTTVVLRAPSRRSPRPRAEPAAGSGLPQSTVEAAVEELTGRGLAGESAATGAVGDHPPGRPTRRFRFRAEAGHVLGVDVGLHKTLLLPAALDGAALTAQLAQHTRQLRASSRLDLLRHAMETFLGTHVPRRSAVRARCVGVPGVVDAGGVVTSVEVPERSGVDLGRPLSDSGRGRTLAENDVHLAVLAERWQGAATLADDVIGGRLHRGGRGSAGGVGVLPLLGVSAARKAPPWPGVRRVGEFGVVASAWAAGVVDPGVSAAVAGGLGVSAARKAPPWPGVRWVGEFEVAAPARGAGAAVAGRLAPGVAAPALAVDPELIVLTGGAAPVGRHPVPLLEERLRPVTPHVPRIALSSLGGRGVALGAVRKALDHVEEELLADTAP
ncbi:ROK family protein [Streptomyces kanamyceticus]|uniref:ROK family protein n=1 Tax=Streptomyces kanamyceticus TaxID=1967 RepID=UPI0037DCE705